MTHLQLVGMIRTRMAKLGMTPYQLHVRLKGTVCKQTIYNFVQNGELARTDTLMAVMEVLGLTIVEQENISHDNKGI